MSVLGIIWPFSKPAQATDPRSVEELGALVKQGGHQIAVELTEITRAQNEMLRRLKRTDELIEQMVRQNAAKADDVAVLSKVVGDMDKSLAATNKMLAKLLEPIPHEDRPTPVPLLRLPLPPRNPTNIGR